VPGQQKRADGIKHKTDVVASVDPIQYAIRIINEVRGINRVVYDGPLFSLLFAANYQREILPDRRIPRVPNKKTAK
jgi:predicted nucleotidyltransferase